MERFIADLVKQYESGAINRREFCQTVTLAATVYAAGDAAHAQAPRGLKLLAINHVSYTCPDYRKARDWYAATLGMEVAPGKDNGKQANLMFGPAQGKGGGYMVVRNGAMPSTPRPSVVDHVCYTIADWDDGKIEGALKASGASYASRPGNKNVLDPFNNPVQLANIEQENPWK